MAHALLLHSGGFTSRQWRRLSERLAPDYTVIAPDLIGYGAEPWPDGKPFHFEQDLDYVASLLSRPAHVVGHSYGGFLALKLALQRPDLVRSVAVYDPVAFGALDESERTELELVRHTWEPDASGVDEPWLRGFVEWWNGRGAWDRLPEETRGAFRRLGWKVFSEVTSLVKDRTPLSEWATITVPALIMGGATSPETERRVVEKLAALPNATIQFIEGAGHMGPVSHAVVVNEAIVRHLAGNQ
jgi:pimeloyl-ACP methyl ester carboxylesterase